MLRRAECGREQRDGERGWRALLTQEEDDTIGVDVFCPECAIREFGRPTLSRRGKLTAR